MAAYWLIIVENVVKSSGMAGYEQNWQDGRFQELRDG
jgi:hypothetical protein